MKKKLLIVAGVLVGVLVIVAVAARFLINANNFRPAIEARLGALLGRTVHVGDLSVSLLSGGLRARDISISDDPAFGHGDFLRAKSLDVSVELVPLLFSRSLRVTGLTLRQPELVLLRSSAGKWNFASLGTGTRAPAKGAAPPSVSIREVRIVNGRVMIASGASRGKAATYDDVTLTARNVTYESRMPFTLAAVTPGGGRVDVSGTAGPLNRGDAARTPLSADIKLRDVNLAQTGFVNPASGLGGRIDYDGKFTSDGRRARTEGNATAEKLQLTRTGAPAKAPVAVSYATDYDLERRSGTLDKGDIHAGKALAHLSGTYSTQGQSTLLHLRFAGSKLPVSDVEDLLPALGVVLPPAASLQDGTADADLAIEGPVDHLVTTGDVNVADARLKGFDLASKMSAVSALAGLKGGSDTLIQTLASGLRITPDGIQADNLRVIIPGMGTMTGRGTIGANNALDFHLVATLASTGQGEALGQLASRIPGLGGAANGTVPFMIRGTTSAPVFVPDVAGIVTDRLVDSLQQRQPKGDQPSVGDILGGLLGKKP